MNTSGERNEDIEDMVVSKLSLMNGGRGACMLIASLVLQNCNHSTY